MTIDTLSAKRSRYSTDAILSASPVRLLTMLYDRLLLDLDRAGGAHQTEDWPTMSANLIHAQAIVSELTTSLRVELWEGADGLRALYTYCSNLLMLSNVRRDGDGIREAIDLLDPLRLAWHEAAAQLSVPSEATDGISRELGIG